MFFVPSNVIYVQYFRCIMDKNECLFFHSKMTGIVEVMAMLLYILSNVCTIVQTYVITIKIKYTLINRLCIC